MKTKLTILFFCIAIILPIMSACDINVDSISSTNEEISDEKVTTIEDMIDIAPVTEVHTMEEEIEKITEMLTEDNIITYRYEKYIIDKTEWTIMPRNYDIVSDKKYDFASEEEKQIYEINNYVSYIVFLDDNKLNYIIDNWYYTYDLEISAKNSNGKYLLTFSENPGDCYINFIDNKGNQYSSDTNSIAYYNVAGIFEHNDEIYFYTSYDRFAHWWGDGAWDEVGIYKINNNKDKKTLDIEKFMSLEDVPMFVYSWNNNIYFFMRTAIYLLREDMVIETISENEYWNALFPTSAVVYDNIMYIGMRNGIATIDLDSDEVLWWQKTK